MTTAWVLLWALSGAVAAAAADAQRPADAVYRHGDVYTVDAHDSVRQALAVRDGRIVYVGTDAGVQSFIGPQTVVIELGGRMLMPGLVDGHMHPLMGGTGLVHCNLNYERLTVAQMQSRIQACLDSSRSEEPDAWLQVSNWFQEAMIGGTETTHATLDVLPTRRPIMVLSSFGHTGLVNRRALQLAHITAATPDPQGGRIERDASGEPTGVLQDSAFEQVESVIPPPTPAQDVQAAEAALEALRSQGVTTFLDADADERSLTAFKGAENDGKLTARAHFALRIRPEQAAQPEAAVTHVRELAARFDDGAIGARPGVTVRNIKLFLDGVITAPACTGAMLQPYLRNAGTAEAPHWIAGSDRGPDVYFPAPLLQRLVLAAAAAGLEPHMHTDGDRAVRAGLDAVQALRRRFSGARVRAALAHDEIVDPADFARYRALDVTPVLSMQWEKPAPDTVDGARDYLGPARYRYIEPAGFLADAGARIAYGSDWPVDRLDEWFAFKVGVTRTNSPDAGPQYQGRLSQDRGLSRAAVLRAVTMNSSYELHQEASTGSLEVGKLADFIVLDRNFLEIPAEEIAHIKVLTTVVGGQVVYRSPDW